ncbi:NmrA-like family protein [Aspergillus clavatus NRRL 1]|uniref:NmrA-like domain-containing protein n=1 Tax=Aspergillus clavatus (strain ATCC 1007 / CBS 513.65 / DSM 816 / NCTC 3887 / NRRL 1 / QM 1276 / 107) TaxID=344612 RepID=A1C8P1_ASPCL|nr:uncharacterized protein ACLA_043980 [Aspergillus clavatus NRRL 1]EAW13678.1 conserved hypothetical protein [Aspergillus clavatus NRRL 1]
MSTVIVFGPTGGVGAATALSAHKHGARVILAMRDTQKPIRGLPSSDEASGNYQRVHADLTQPDTIREAVTSTGAKHAFIYVSFGSPDSMRASIEALKSAGIETVVLLSSLSVQVDIRDVPPSDFIAYTHARVEVNLDEVFGPRGYVAVRPAFFSSNTLWWKTEVVQGEAKTAFPEARLDFIAPEDIGSVCGAFLAKGLPTGTSFVHLAGPEQMPIKEAVEVMGKGVGKQVKVVKVSEDEGIEVMMTIHGMPEPMARNLSRHYQTDKGNGASDLFQMPGYEEAVGNVERYTGKPSLRFHEWVALNRDKILA